MQVGQTLFLKVDEAGQPGIAVLSMPTSQANAEMSNTRRQIHTISRAKAALTCGEPGKAAVVTAPPPPPPPPRPPAPREYALETDALFEFGKAELRASGFNAIEALVQRLNQDYSSVDRIRVVGYTDAIGSHQINKKLSQQRADVVARQISARNVKPTRGIEAEGRGSIELSKTGCRNEPTPENKICHAPIPALGDLTAVNHVDITQGAHVLKLTMGDVLDLGVKNSFSIAAAHKDHLQIRIDGDAADTVNLDDLVGTTDLDWTKNNSAVTLGGKDYAAYTNDALGLSLFVQTGITLNLV
jgi:outer membrane protein OmpA-like peptidoglycan-associated protein